MRKVMSGILAAFFVVFSATTLFAGKRIDYGWSADVYKYDIVSGEVTSIDHDESALKLDNERVYFSDKTKFYEGDIDTDMEAVYGGAKWDEKDRIKAREIEKGKLMKCRFSRDASGRIFIDTCLIEN